MIGTGNALANIPRLLRSWMHIALAHPVLLLGREHFLDDLRDRYAQLDPAGAPQEFLDGREQGHVPEAASRHLAYSSTAETSGMSKGLNHSVRSEEGLPLGRPEVVVVLQSLLDLLGGELGLALGVLEVREHPALASAVPEEGDRVARLAVDLPRVDGDGGGLVPHDAVRLAVSDSGVRKLGSVALGGCQKCVRHSPGGASTSPRKTTCEPHNPLRVSWWAGLDSNQRTLTRTDLQSVAFNHSATYP